MLHAHIKLRNCRYSMACIAPCKGIHADNLGFWIPRLGLRNIPGTGFQSLSMELEFWIVNSIPDSLSCILEFQRPSLPADVLWGFVRHAFISPPRTSAKHSRHSCSPITGRLQIFVKRNPSRFLRFARSVRLLIECARNL